MKMVDSTVVREGGVLMLGPKFSKETEICDRASRINTSSKCDGFPGVHALQASHGFAVPLQFVGQSVQPNDAVLHGRCSPALSGSKRRCCRRFDIAGGGPRERGDDATR